MLKKERLIKFQSFITNMRMTIFRGNTNPRIHAKEPMNNFVERLKNLHKEVLVYHKQTDRNKTIANKRSKRECSKTKLKREIE